MKRRLLRVLALALAGPLVVVLGAGALSPADYRGIQQALLDAPLEKTWALVNDVEGLPKRNLSVKSVEVMARKGTQPMLWREHMDMGRTAVIEVTDWKPRERVQWSMRESSFGMTGSWTLLLKDEAGKTRVELREESRTVNWATRAALAMAGRDVNMKRMLADFEKALK